MPASAKEGLPGASLPPDSSSHAQLSCKLCAGAATSSIKALHALRSFPSTAEKLPTAKRVAHYSQPAMPKAAISVHELLVMVLILPIIICWASAPEAQVPVSTALPPTTTGRAGWLARGRVLRSDSDSDLDNSKSADAHPVQAPDYYERLVAAPAGMAGALQKAVVLPAWKYDEALFDREPFRQW